MCFVRKCSDFLHESPNVSILVGLRLVAMLDPSLHIWRELVDQEGLVLRRYEKPAHALGWPRSSSNSESCLWAGFQIHQWIHSFIAAMSWKHQLSAILTYGLYVYSVTSFSDKTHFFCVILRNNVVRFIIYTIRIMTFTVFNHWNISIVTNFMIDSDISAIF